MARIRNVLIVAGVALGASALLPAVPASADTVTKYAHALFRNDTDNIGMDIDVVKTADGTTTIDVEWHDSHCGLVDTVYVCDSVSRRAYDVPVSRFSFSLTGVTSVRAEVPYRELRQHCTFTDGDEVCSTEPEATGTTTVEVSWTASGEPVREVRTDEQGVKYVTTWVGTSVAGTGFGLSYGGESSYGQVHRVRTIVPS